MTVTPRARPEPTSEGEQGDRGGRNTGFYLKGGVGIGRNAVQFEDGFDTGDTGFAGLVGAGYELRLGRRLYLNPVIDFVGHSYSDRFDGSYKERLVNFGLGILLQTGS